MTREEAINKIRQWSLPKETRDILEALAPELKENEDEKVRKEIVNFFKNFKETGTWKSISDVNTWIDYLEKQQEQNVVPSRETILGIWELGNFWKEYPEEREGLTQLRYIQKYWNEKCDYQKEQKPINNSTREKIISRATSEKQVVLLSESNGNAEIGWDTRSLEDAKKLLEYGIAFINERLGTKPAECGDDEKIRKRLIQHLKELRNWKVGTMSPIKVPAHYDAWITYLEKQKEQKPVECIEFDNEFEKQVSHLLASVLNGEWEYNEGFVKHAAQSLLGYAKNELEFDGKTLLYTADKSYQIGFRDGVASVKPAEWAELQSEFKNINEAFENGKKEVIDHPDKYGLTKQKPVESIEGGVLTHLGNED